VAGAGEGKAHVKINTALEQIRAGGVSLGMFSLEFPSNGLARTAASAGADFIVFDQEHTGWSAETIGRLLVSARAFDIVPLVRVPTSERHGISVALALGAAGIMVPMVNSAAETRAIVEAAKYPPLGKRGFAVLYDDEVEGDVAEYMDMANRQTAVIVMIETAAALSELDEIAAVDGVDVLWVGHYDLTASLGIAGQFAHPTFRAALERVVAACEANGITAGMSSDDIEESEELLRSGYRFLACGHDLVLLRSGLRAAVQMLRATFPAPVTGIVPSHA
jgi:2-keto-3-deoxy-L-rhamnonate aldolase RhmA